MLEANEQMRQAFVFTHTAAQQVISLFQKLGTPVFCFTTFLSVNLLFSSNQEFKLEIT